MCTTISLLALTLMEQHYDTIIKVLHTFVILGLTSIPKTASLEGMEGKAIQITITSHSMSPVLSVTTSSRTPQRTLEFLQVLRKCLPPVMVPESRKLSFHVTIQYMFRSIPDGGFVKLSTYIVGMRKNCF